MYRQRNKKAKFSLKGLSLVEILVVLGLFSMISIIALATLLNTQSINTKLQQTQSILDNVNLSVQTMTRDIRYGSEFFCTSTQATTTPQFRNGCPHSSSGGGKALFFKPENAANSKDRVVYYIQNGKIYKAELPFGQASTTYQITADNVEIATSTFLFYVDGAQSSDGSIDIANKIDYQQPLVSLFITGVTVPSSAKERSVPFHIQTAISSRVPDTQ